LLCTFCGGEIKIISFITEPKTVKKILDAMDLPSQKPEPLAHSPPLFTDTTYVPLQNARLTSPPAQLSATGLFDASALSTFLRSLPSKSYDPHTPFTPCTKPPFKIAWTHSTDSLLRRLWESKWL